MTYLDKKEEYEVQQESEQARKQRNCFTITADGSLHLGIEPTVHSQSVRRNERTWRSNLTVGKKTVTFHPDHFGTGIISRSEPRELFLTAELDVLPRGAFEPLLILKLPRSTQVPYFLVKVTAELPRKVAQRFKGGDPSRRVESGVSGTAEVVLTHEHESLLRVFDGDVVNIMYPNGLVRRYRRTGTCIREESLTHEEMLKTRLAEAEVNFARTQDTRKRTNLENGLLKLLRLQKQREHVELILEFFQNRDLSSKVESSLRTTLAEMEAKSGFRFGAVSLRVLRNERRSAMKRPGRKQLQRPAQQHSISLPRQAEFKSSSH